jgi:hypothetical protein
MKLKGKNHMEDLGVVRTILKWILRKLGLAVWIGFIWFMTETREGLL